MSEPTNLWNAAYEASPAGTDLISNGDDEIRDFKKDIRERHEREHVRNATDKELDGLHREGSARAYYEASEPTDRPDGTSLDTNDDGRLWYDPDSNVLYVWTGSTWEIVSNQFTTSPIGSKTANYTITDDDGIATVLMTTGGTDRTVTLPTAADNNNRIITVKKVDNGSGYLTLDGEGSEEIEGHTTLRFEKQYSGCTVVCDGTTWHVTETIGCSLLEIDGSLEAVYEVYLSGTLANDSVTYVDISSDFDSGKFVSVTTAVMASVFGKDFWYLYDYRVGESTSTYATKIDIADDRLMLSSVSSSLEGREYKASIRYYV